MDDGYYYVKGIKEGHGKDIIQIRDEYVFLFGDAMPWDLESLLEHYEIIQKVKDPTIDDYNERELPYPAQYSSCPPEKKFTLEWIVAEKKALYSLEKEGKLEDNEYLLGSSMLSTMVMLGYDDGHFIDLKNIDPAKAAKIKEILNGDEHES